jgi:predicted Zn finger-like uncharacterized protein
MKITCQACAAKYTIADDKVLGKVVKIRCKKCGATIVVNGNDPAAAGSGAGAHAAPAYDYAPQSAGGDQWTVNVADGDQRTMTDQEVADAYHAGAITDETFCWKDGMTDWLPLREIEPLYAACTSTRAMPPPSQMPAARHSDMPTRIQDTGGLVLGGGGAAPAAAPYVPPMAAPALDAGNGGGMYADASPVAARRVGGRAATADLFSGAAQAGSEEDVMTSAPAGIPQPHHDDQAKLTGARNENSVLFSLNALTSKGPGGGAPMQATSEASGLIDIKQLGAQIGLGGPEKKRSAVDDIMNLAGGGAFSPSLNAPVLSAPPIEEYAPPPEAAAALPGPAPKNKLVLFGAIGAGVVVIALAVGAAALLMRGKDETADSKAAASASAAVASASAATDTPSPSASVAAATTDTATQSAQPTPPPAPTSENNSGSTGSKSTTSAPAATTKPVAAAAPTQAVVPEAPAAPPAAAAAAPAQDQPFNMGAAKASLGAIAGAVQGCKRGDTSGTGRVVVTFAPSGAVQSAVVTDPPFAGTPTGSCVASRFRSAHVPAFSGSPFEVAKHFTIN